MGVIRHMIWPMFVQAVSYFLLSIMTQSDLKEAFFFYVEAMLLRANGVFAMGTFPRRQRFVVCIVIGYKVKSSNG